MLLLATAPLSHSDSTSSAPFLPHRMDKKRIDKKSPSLLIESDLVLISNASYTGTFLYLFRERDRDFLYERNP